MMQQQRRHAEEGADERVAIRDEKHRHGMRVAHGVGERRQPRLPPDGHQLLEQKPHDDHKGGVPQHAVQVHQPGCVRPDGIIQRVGERGERPPESQLQVGRRPPGKGEAAKSRGASRPGADEREDVERVRREAGQPQEDRAMDVVIDHKPGRQGRERRTTATTPGMKTQEGWFRRRAQLLQGGIAAGGHLHQTVRSTHKWRSATFGSTPAARCAGR